jgi:hypothetical protein
MYDNKYGYSDRVIDLIIFTTQNDSRNNNNTETNTKQQSYARQ